MAGTPMRCSRMSSRIAAPCASAGFAEVHVNHCALDAAVMPVDLPFVMMAVTLSSIATVIGARSRFVTTN